MTDSRCKGCKEPLSIVYDSYYKITVEHDTAFQEKVNTYRYHTKCWEERIK